jgi:hypothetical protein
MGPNGHPCTLINCVEPESKGINHWCCIQDPVTDHFGSFYMIVQSGICKQLINLVLLTDFCSKSSVLLSGQIVLRVTWPWNT